MLDESQTMIRGIYWREAFPFTNLFRSFRIAMHPSKIVLALVALILLYSGGCLLDWAWPVSGRAVPGEASLYETVTRHPQPGQNFPDERQRVRRAIESDYADQLVEYQIEKTPEAARRAAVEGDDLSRLKQAIIDKRDQVARQAQVDHDKALAAAGPAGRRPDDAHIALEENYQTTVRTAFTQATTAYRRACQIDNVGLFECFYDYESNQISNAIRGVMEANWFGEEKFDTASADAVLPVVNPLGIPAAPPVAMPVVVGKPGVVQSLYRCIAIGPIWLLSQHVVFFILFGAMFLVLWSIFGGAICRIAAVHVARDEKLSIRTALLFSAGKFLSFLFAPIIPLLILPGLGVLLFAASLLGNIPYIGPIVIGAAFILALGAGFVMSLVLLGLIGGFNLMFPTIAVEGTDSFDAISRSISYLYHRPWRLGFYTLVAFIYGTACFLFLRLFINLMLLLTHRAVGFGFFSSAPSTAPLWTSLWPDPILSGRLAYSYDSLSLNAGQAIGARLIWLWVHLIIAILGAFVVSFYFSASTIVYYLIRREVDAVDLDDIYLEQGDDDFADPIKAAKPTDAAEPAPAAPAIEPDIAPPT